MIVFLDASPVIYFVEQPLVWGPKVVGRIGRSRAAGDNFAVTELVRMECLVGPVKSGDTAAAADFMRLLAQRH